GGGDPSGTVQTFELRGVPPGSYYVNASWRQNEMIYFSRARVDVGDADVNGLSLEVRPSLNVPGKIVLESEPPQPFNMTQLFVGATPLDQTTGLFAGATRPNADGTFVLKSIAPVEYRIALQ